MITIAIAIHKGGTSKSTTALNLAYELTRTGRRVLLVDLDYQASLTAMSGLPDSPGHNITQVMTGKSTMRTVARPLRPGLSIVPSDIELADTELTLANKIGRENILKRALSAVDGFDVAILDCPPSLSVMTINALAAAAGVLVPLQPTPTDLRALDLFMTTLDEIERVVNPALVLLGVILTFFDQRYSLHGDVVKHLDEAGIPVVAKIGRSVKIAESTGAHLPLSEYDADNPQVTSYHDLSKAVIAWLNDHN